MGHVVGLSMGKVEMCTKFGLECLKGRDHSEVLSLYGRIMLNES